MKVVSVGLSALFAGSYAQQASVLTDLSQVKWTEISPEGTKDDSGNIITQSDPQNLFVEIQTQAEMDTEQADIVEYRKKFDGIYDLNMYPYAQCGKTFKNRPVFEKRFSKNDSPKNNCLC